MEWIKKQLAWLIDQLLCLLVSFLTGVRPKPAAQLNFEPQQKVYYANHGSHGDFLLVWISLPRRWRIPTRPVAGADYWLTHPIKRFIIQNVFNALLIPRNSDHPEAITAQMQHALQTQRLQCAALLRQQLHQRSQVVSICEQRLLALQAARAAQTVTLRNAAGHTVASVADVQAGEQLQAVLADGHLQLQVLSSQKSR